MNTDYKQVSYAYRIFVSQDLFGSDEFKKILESSNDIMIKIEGVQLHFEYTQNNSKEGNIIPSSNIGSAFGYTSLHLSPKTYDIDSFLDFCESVGIKDIEIVSKYNYSGACKHITLSQTCYYNDYGKLISYLCEKGIVKTKNSKSFLTTDGRVFTIVKTNPKVKSYLKSHEDLKDFAGTWFEVDCLGSSIHQELSSFIEELAQL